jgi:hypothetical protein
MMGLERASSIKVPSMWWCSFCFEGLLFLFIFAMDSFHFCQKKKNKSEGFYHRLPFVRKSQRHFM